jgi:hypothetical protein
MDCTEALVRNQYVGVRIEYLSVLTEMSHVRSRRDCFFCGDQLRAGEVHVRFLLLEVLLFLWSEEFKDIDLSLLVLLD